MGNMAQKSCRLDIELQKGSVYHVPLMSFQLYDLPAEMPRASDLTMTIEGQPLPIGRCQVADYVIFALDAPVSCCLTLPAPVEKPVIQPASTGIKATVQGNRLYFVLDRPRQIGIELPGRLPLYVFAHPVEKNPPRRDDPKVRFLEAGRIHDLGQITLNSGETLYLEGGAVLRGRVFASQAEHITIRGHGIYGWQSPSTPDSKANRFGRLPRRIN